MLDLNKLYSEGILGQFREIIKIILDYFKLVGINRLIGNKIPIKKFEQKGFILSEIEAIINRIAKEENNIIQIDSSERKAMPYELSPEEKLEEKAELKNYIFLTINDKDRLEKLFGKIDRKLGKVIKSQPTIRQNGKEKDKRLVDFLKSCGALRIKNYNPIIFKAGLRRELVDFFYNSDNKKWKTYENIKEKIPGYDSAAIRKAIEAINKRIEKRTNGKIKEIIEIKMDESDFNFAKQYRWKL